MTEKVYHGNKWMPALYANFFGILKDVAREYGYALAIHGTLNRDLDLVAVPWVEDVKPHLEMFAAFRERLGIVREDGAVFDSVEEKPHGRIGYTIGTGGGGYLDIAVFPPLPDLDTLAGEIIEAEDRAEASVRGTPDFAFAERVKLARLTAVSAVLQQKIGKGKE